MESSRNPPVCPPICAQVGGAVSASSLTGRITQFPQAGLRTAVDQGSVRIRPCGILEESVWSPRGFLELSTISCTCVNNRVNPVEQLEERSRMNRGQPENLHRRRVFILETPPGHPHGTTPPEQRIRPQSTESTAPTTTSVLLIRDLSSKQGVWKLGTAASASQPLPVHSKDDTGITDPIANRRKQSAPAVRRACPRIVGPARAPLLGAVIRGAGGSGYVHVPSAGTVLCRSPVPDCEGGRFGRTLSSTDTDEPTTDHGTGRGQIGRWSLQA